MNYYIQGNKEKAEEINAAFERLGIDTSANSNYGISNLFYFSCNGEVAVTQNRSIINIIKTHPDYKELELPTGPKFKVGDSLQSGSHFTKILSINLEEERYYCNSRIISFKNQDLWHLVPKPHYDIKNFKPFDKVLVRDRDESKWGNTYFGFYDEEQKVFVCDCYEWEQCIPFEGNERLLGTTDMPSEEYINWQRL